MSPYLTSLARRRPAAVLTLILVVARESVGTRLKKVVVFMFVTIALVLPWSVRNYIQMGDWVTFTTHGGITFYESNNMLNYEVPEFRGIVVLPRRAVPDWDEIRDLPEVEHDRRAWRWDSTSYADIRRSSPTWPGGSSPDSGG
jgi:hypothetical protein